MEVPVFFQDFMSLVFPHYCLGCGQGLESREGLICTRCRFQLPKTDHHKHPENEVWQKFIGRIHIESAQSFLHFQKGGISQALIHKLKYEGYAEIGNILGRWYGGLLKKTPLAKNWDLIVPVPLHVKKFKTRGYNQSDGFAEGLSEVLGIEWKADLIKRNVHGKSQTKKDDLERFTAVERIFELQYPEIAKNKHILLVDDVMTTGATLENCAAAILEVSGTKVSLATVAFASD